MFSWIINAGVPADPPHPSPRFGPTGHIRLADIALYIAPSRILPHPHFRFTVRGESHIVFVTLSVVPTLRGREGQDRDANQMKLFIDFSANSCLK